MPKPRAAGDSNRHRPPPLPVRKTSLDAVSPNIRSAIGAIGRRHLVRRFKRAATEWTKRLALADDLEPADGKAVLTWWQAVEAARAFVRKPEAAADAGRPATAGRSDRRLRPRPAGPRRHAYNATVPASTCRRRCSQAGRAVSADELCRGGATALWQGPAAVHRQPLRNRRARPLTLAAKRDRRITNRHAWEDDFDALPDATVARNSFSPTTSHRVVGGGLRTRPCARPVPRGAGADRRAASQIARLEVGRPRRCPAASADAAIRQRPSVKARQEMLERVPVPIPAGRWRCSWSARSTAARATLGCYVKAPGALERNPSYNYQTARSSP